jgi:hypothetical protein
MRINATRITRSCVRSDTYRRRKLLLAATYGLTSSLVAPTLHAGHCSTPENDHGASIYLIKSALPFIGDRGVRIQPNERAASTLARVAKPSRTRTTPPGDTR